MGYYPICLDMRGKRCLVIGGGPVAERKVDGLLGAEAIVTVISPSITERLRRWRAEGKLRHVERLCQSGDLEGYNLVFVATDDKEISAMVAKKGHERRVWVNAADDPAHCDFILPAVLRRGQLLVAITTGSLSPALSRAIREELEAYFTEDYGTLAEIVGEVRRELTGRSTSPSAEAWRRALNGDLRRLIQEGKQQEARAYLLKQLGVEI